MGFRLVSRSPRTTLSRILCPATNLSSLLPSRPRLAFLFPQPISHLHREGLFPVLQCSATARDALFICLILLGLLCASVILFPVVLLPTPCSPDKAAMLRSLQLEVVTLSTSSDLTLLAPGEGAPLGCSVAIVDEATTVHMLLKGILDPAMEITKLEKKVRAVAQYHKEKRGRRFALTSMDASLGAPGP